MGEGRNRWAIAVGFLVVVLLVVLDQWSKAAVVGWLAPDAWLDGRRVMGYRSEALAGEWLSFIPSGNWGAAFGVLDEYPEVLVGGRVLAIGFLAVLLCRADTRYRMVFVAMVLVLAGAVGNVIDNLWTGWDPGQRPYGVRDFVSVWFEPLVSWDYRFPSFNVADACISVGACVWVGWGLFGCERGDEEASEPADPEPVGEGDA
jgi:signal peptidase II